MPVLTTIFNGNPNVGLAGYCATADGKRLCLLGERLHQEEQDEIARALGAEVHHLTVAGTPMPGVFLAGNGYALLVPGIAFHQEIELLKRLGLPIHVFETGLTCLGNNLVANEHGCIASPEFTAAELKRLEKLLKVPVKKLRIAGLDTPGACLVLNGSKGVIHRDASEEEIATVKEVLGLDSLEPASVGLGSPYVRAGVLANDYGFVVSSQSGGPEIVHIEQSLGYLEKKGWGP